MIQSMEYWTLKMKIKLRKLKWKAFVNIKNSFEFPSSKQKILTLFIRIFEEIHNSIGYLKLHENSKTFRWNPSKRIQAKFEALKTIIKNKKNLPVLPHFTRM